MNPRWKKIFARLHHDEGGNVIVLYVAASLLLVAMVWAIIGTGARAVQKETIQSSADAAAFSASVIKAKGLNIISFCNLVMALLLALVMLLRAVKYILIGFATLVTICAAVPVIVNPLEPICAGIVSPVDNFAYNTYPQLEDKAERFIKAAMKGLSVTERAIARVTPILSFAEAYHIGHDAAYQKNFGKGSLMTVSWPLPIEQLPVKDGTCQDLAKNAVQYIHDLAELVIKKVTDALHLPGAIAGWFADAVQAIVSPLAGTLCGGNATLPVERAETITNCQQCQTAQNVQASQWVGNSGVTEGNVIGGKFKTPDEKGKQCRMASMPSWSCDKGAKQVMCSDTDDKVWNWMEFQSCTVKKKTNEQVTGTSDWPPPLVFTDGWEQKVNTRAFTVLTDSNMDARRQSVSIAMRKSDKGGAAPMTAAMMAMAQAEWMAWNGHADLWHMDWRARLVPFTFGNTASGDTSAAGDVPKEAAGMVSKIIDDFLAKSGTASFKDQFLLH
ncbi:MAG: hypothetical protein JWN44_2016 [Myxococcales bacterium]|nr:hypothetical protein [Myxococcales bacterium]